MAIYASKYLLAIVTALEKPRKYFTLDAECFEKSAQQE